MGLLHPSRISKCQKWCEINTILYESPFSFIRCPGIEKFVEKKKEIQKPKKITTTTKTGAASFYFERFQGVGRI